MAKADTKRYKNDSKFKRLVDIMINQYDGGGIGTEDMIDAAMTAQLIINERAIYN